MIFLRGPESEQSAPRNLLTLPHQAKLFLARRSGDRHSWVRYHVTTSRVDTAKEASIPNSESLQDLF